MAVSFGHSGFSDIDYMQERKMRDMFESLVETHGRYGAERLMRMYRNAECEPGTRQYYQRDAQPQEAAQTKQLNLLLLEA